LPLAYLQSCQHRTPEAATLERDIQVRHSNRALSLIVPH
jgi:hypothetical protein